MKRFLIAIIILIPVVIMISLSVTGAIISSTITVNVERLIIYDSNDKELDFTSTYTLDLVGGEMHLIIIALPAISYNTEVNYRLTENSEGVVELIKGEGRRYIIKPVSSGAVTIVIYAQNNVNANKIINIYVTSNSIAGFNIKSKQEIIDNTLYLTESLKLYATFYPAEAIRQNIILWESSNPRIASVDNNGKVEIKGKGITEIKAQVYDMAGTMHEAVVRVDTTGAIVKAKSFFIDRENNNKEWIINNIVLDKALANVTEIFSNNEKSIYQIVCNDFEIIVQAFNVNYDDWDIINKDDISTVYIDNGGYFIKSTYLSMANISSLEVAYSSSNESVLSIDSNGRIIPHSQGTVIVRAYLDFNDYRDIEIKVKARANSFALNLTEESNKLGLMQDRVWGINFIEDSLNPAELSQNYSLYYHTRSATFRGGVVQDFELYWEAEDASLAEIDENGKITFKSVARGNEVKIVATELVHGIKSNLQRSYTFKMLESENAVNVFEKDLAHGTNINANNTIDYISSVLGFPIALHTDIYIEKEDAATKYSYALLRNSLWGNGFTISAENWVSELDPKNGFKPIPGNEDGLTRYSKVLYVDTSRLSSSLEELVIENINLKGSKTPENLAVGVRDFDSRGQAIEIITSENRSIPIKMRFIDIRYFNDGIHLATRKGRDTCYDITIESSILGDVFRFVIYLEQLTKPNNSKFLIKNIVFKTSQGPSLMLTPGTINLDMTFDDILNNYLPKIIIDGFIDNYNWKRTNQFESIFMGLIDPTWFEGYEGILSFIESVLKDALVELFSLPTYSNLIYKDEAGREWVSLVAFVSGIWADTNIDAISIYNNDYDILNMPLPTRHDGGMIAAFLNLARTYLQINESATSSKKVPIPLEKSCNIISYKFSDNAPAILPEQPCPNDADLLNRLKGQ